MANNTEPSFDDLSVFLAVCETAGFRAAARRLGLAPSNVSDTVARLEASLGVPLLTRTTRSVVPTEAGRELVQRLAPLWTQARHALSDIASTRHEVRGLLKINVTGAVMVDILPPLVDRFLERHPQVRMEIVVEDRLVDVVAEGCAAGIRYGEHLAQDMVSLPIGPRVQRLALAASPGYLARHERLRTLTHWSTMPAYGCAFPAGALTAWDFQRGEQSITVDPPARLVIGVDAAPAAIDLACAGHGLMCTFANWLEPHLASGALVPVLPHWWQSFEGPRLYFPGRRVPAPLRAFIQVISEDQASPSVDR